MPSHAPPVLRDSVLRQGQAAAARLCFDHPINQSVSAAVKGSSLTGPENSMPATKRSQKRGVHRPADGHCARLYLKDSNVPAACIVPSNWTVKKLPPYGHED